MLAGFYTAASGILVQQRNLNEIGNNLTNSQTVGYRSRRLVQSTFEHDFLTRYENGEYTNIGEGDPVSLVDIVETNFNENSLEDTTWPYDMALVGEGFFNILGEERQYLTRNGNFNIDAEGYLVLDGVGRVMGESGELYIGGPDFTVTNDGYVFDENNRYVDKLLITQPAENAPIYKFDNGMYVTENAEVLQNSTVYQKTLERSNVDMNLEYTKLIEAQRNFQACATALTTVDNMNAKAATLSSITG
ncbi:MAG: flagellar hook-basal body complex protein [Oscillospiraceae bacterium]|nr:flagellar hook-basal body complex protein [Oscillospiraceae bacterium]